MAERTSDGRPLRMLNIVDEFSRECLKIHVKAADVIFELKEFRSNDRIDYRFVQRGSGIGDWDSDKEIRWYMSKKSRLAVLTDLETGVEHLFDFTRYDVPVREPTDVTRWWSLMGQINQKQTRAQNRPVLFRELSAEDQQRISRLYPEIH